MTERQPGTGRAWRPLQRLLRVVAFLVLAVLLLVLGAYLLRGPLFGRLLADRIERELGARIGGRFSVERVEGSYLFDLALVGLRTEEPPAGALRRLDCGRAVVEFDLRRLIDGDLGAIESVLASNADVEIDQTRKGGALGAAELPKHLPRVELYGRIAVATGMGEVRAEGLSINTVGRDKLGIRTMELRLPARFGPGAPFAGVVTRTGPRAFALDSDTPVAGVTVVHATYDGSLDADLRVGNSRASLHVALGRARFLSESLDLARLPGWVRGLLPEGVPPPHEAVAAVRIDVRSFRPLALDLSAAAARVRWRDLDLRDVRVDVHHEDGVTLVREARAEGEGFLLDAKDVALDPGLPWLVGDVGAATLRVPDLRALEPRLDRPLSFSVTARRESAGGFRIYAARLEGEGILLEGRGEVLPPDDPARWREARLSGTYAGGVRDFASGAYAFAGEMRVTGDVTGTLAAPEASARVEGSGLVVEGRTVERAMLALRLTPPVLRVLELRVEAEAGTLRAEGAVDLDARTLTDGSYEIDVVDLEGFLRLFPGAPSAEGSLSGRGRVVADAKGPRGTAELAVAGLVSRGRELGNLSVRARADGREIAVDHAEAIGPWGAAKGRGVVRWDEAWASVEALDIDAGPVHARLNRPFRVAWTAGEAHAGTLDFAALGGRVQGTAALKDGERLEMSLHGEEIDLSLLDGRLAGRAVADLRIDGDRYEIDATAPAATYEGRTAEARLKARSGLDGIVVERLLLRAGEQITAEGTATLPWRFDGRAFERVETVEASLALEVRAQGLTVRGVAVGGAVVSVRGQGRDLTSTVRLRDLSVDGFAVRGETWVEVAATPGRVEATAALERCDLGDAEARVAADKGFDWTRPDEIPLDAARLKGEIRLRAPDLAAFRRLVPGLTELSGTADGTLALSGPLHAPSIEGRVHFAGVGAKVEGPLPRFTGGRGDFLFDGRTLRVEALSGELAYAPVAAEGKIDLGAPGGPVVDLRLTGRNALLFADPALRVRADIDLVLSGAPDALRLGGRAVITDALYTRARSLLARGNRTASGDAALFRIRRAPLGSATLDLEVTADETIRIRTPTLKGEFSCDLRIRGTGEAPAPEGRIFFRDLLVEMHPVAALKVDRGEIRFPPGEPFDPWLDVTAHTRLKGYDLEVGLDGRIDDADLRISSRPALSQDEAILLLATGFTREELEREGIGQAAFENLASFLGAQLVSRFSGPRDPDERTFLDRFRFTVGKDVSRSGDDTIEAEFEASRKLFLRVERDRFDDYNGSVVWRIRFR